MQTHLDQLDVSDVVGLHLLGFVAEPDGLAISFIDIQQAARHVPEESMVLVLPTWYCLRSNAPLRTVLRCEVRGDNVPLYLGDIEYSTLPESERKEVRVLRFLGESEQEMLAVVAAHHLRKVGRARRYY